MKLLAAFALAALSAGPAVAAGVTPAPIVAAERAFAADGLALGVRDSFLKHATPDAVMIAAQPRTVTEVFADQPPGKPADAPTLVWWPLWAGIARSGDLGFTTGPVEQNGKRGGHYFTIWKKQPKGGWKWIYDGGVGATSKDEPAQGSPVAYLAPSTAHAASAAAAMKEVNAAEAEFRDQARSDQKAAHLAWLAEDAHLYVAPRAPAVGAEAFAAALATYPATFAFAAPSGGEASKGGDLAWTYGAGEWLRDAIPQTGHYVHVWQKRTDGWKLVFSQLLIVPPRPSQAG